MEQLRTTLMTHSSYTRIKERKAHIAQTVDSVASAREQFVTAEWLLMNNDGEPVTKRRRIRFRLKDLEFDYHFEEEVARRKAREATNAREYFMPINKKLLDAVEKSRCERENKGLDNTMNATALQEPVLASLYGTALDDGNVALRKTTAGTEQADEPATADGGMLDELYDSTVNRGNVAFQAATNNEVSISTGDKTAGRSDNNSSASDSISIARSTGKTSSHPVAGLDSTEPHNASGHTAQCLTLPSQEESLPLHTLPSFNVVSSPENALSGVTETAHRTKLSQKSFTAHNHLSTCSSEQSVPCSSQLDTSAMLSRPTQGHFSQTEDFLRAHNLSEQTLRPDIASQRNEPSQSDSMSESFAAMFSSGQPVTSSQFSKSRSQRQGNPLVAESAEVKQEPVSRENSQSSTQPNCRPIPQTAASSGSSQSQTPAFAAPRQPPSKSVPRTAKPSKTFVQPAARKMVPKFGRK